MSHANTGNTEGMNRREFVQVTSAAAAGTALLGMLPKGTEAVERYPHWGEVVVVRNNAVTDGPDVRADEVRMMLDSALRRLTGASSATDAWDHLLPGWQEDHLIAIKVNAISKRLAHPEVAYAIAASLVGFGVPANNIIIYDRPLGDGVAGCGYTVNTGSEGVRCFHNQTSGWGYDKDQPIKIGSYTQRLSTILTRSDHLINVPVLKISGLPDAVVSLSMKNHLGTTSFPRGLHDDFDFVPCCAELNAQEEIKRKTRLIVIDALFGGNETSPVFVANSLILSADPVAVDTAGADMLSLGPIAVPLLGKAAEMGLGASPEEIQKVSLYAGTQVGVVLSATTMPGAMLVGRSTDVKIRVVLDPVEEDADAPRRMQVDLSPVGGESEFSLTHVGDGRYTGDTQVTPSEPGRIELPMTVETGADERVPSLPVTLEVYPDGDMVIYEEGLGGGWRFEVTRGESDLSSSMFVREGDSFSHAIDPGGLGSMAYVFEDPEGLDPFGYTHLEFYINGGDASGQDPIISGRRLKDLGIVPAANTWTPVSIPVSEFLLTQGRLKRIEITGMVRKAIYISDMRLVVADLPAPTAVEMVEERVVPSAYALSPNYPNPFNAETTIPYELPRSGVVRLSLYNAAGQRTRVLVEGERLAGTHLATWDGRDDDGLDVASGVYVCRMAVDGRAVGTRRMTLLR